MLVGYGDADPQRDAARHRERLRGRPQAQLARRVGLSPRTRARNPGEQITQVILDASYWNPSDKWDASWKRTEQTIGYHSEVTALQVDGDRADPTKQTSPRSTDPITRAGKLFVDALQAADTGGVVADNVASPPVPRRVARCSAR